MAQVVLDATCVLARISELVAARMAQHVGLMRSATACHYLIRGNGMVFGQKQFRSTSLFADWLDDGEGECVVVSIAIAEKYASGKNVTRQKCIAATRA
jgi:hypothetical protein